MRSARIRSERARALSDHGLARWSFLARLLLLSACSTADDPSTGTAGDVPDGTAPSGPAPVLAGIEHTIGSHLDASADGDVAGASTDASEGFPAQIDATSFEWLITDAYPVVAVPESFSVEGCRSDQASAEVLVHVIGVDGGRTSLV